VKRFVTVLAALAAASALRASDAPPPKTDEAPPPKTADAPPPNTEASTPPKHRLGGGFKGSAVGTSPGGSAPARKPVAAPKKTGPTLVIDNKMVQGASGPASASPGAPPPPPPAPAPSAPAPPASVETPKIVDLQGHDEAYWRAKAAATRDAVRKAQDALAAAEADEKRDENDFYSWDDGQYRDNVIKPAWDRAKEEAARARENLAAAQKDLDGLEDEARRAGAYPGWIR
jgi:hypothetical protein